MSRGATGDTPPARGQQSPPYNGPRTRNATSAPLRTRGPFRPLDCGRGPDGDGPTQPVSIGDLVGELRAHVYGLPLTYILHGWGGASAEEFLKLLRPSLLADDALWLIPADVGT